MAYNARMFIITCLFIVTCFKLTVQAPHERSENTETTENGEIIWEDDMILSKDQYDSIHGINRKARDDLKYRWPQGKVPFAISESSEQDRDVIMEAVEHWRQSSCLIFNEVPENSEFPHIIFVKKKGCHSPVGLHAEENPFGQEISIGHGCEKKGKVAHEIGHAIGFYHEQSRPDRDNYVIIREENIEEEHFKNFVIHNNINSYNVPYDLSSIMHYNAKEFTANGKNTIVTYDIMKQFVIGQRKEISFYDRQLVNIMYNCSDKCASKPKCTNGGFVDHKCQCQCPSDYTGEFCENIVIPAKPECGGIIEKDGTLSSPNFPDYYPTGTNCVWWIKAPVGKIVSVSFDTFQVGSHSSHKCRDSSIEIRTSDLYDGEIYCGDKLSGKSIESESNEMVILLWSKVDYSDLGFDAQIYFN